MLSREFEGKIGFQSRPQMTQIDLVYNKRGGGTYDEAALFSIGVSGEQLIHNVAERLRDVIKSIKLVPWPPRVEELEEEDLSPLMVQLLSAFWGKKRVYLSHSLSPLSSHSTSSSDLALPPSMPPSPFTG